MAGSANILAALGNVPTPAGDVVVEPGVAVHENVDAGAVLGRHVAGEAVEMLFPVGQPREALRQRNAAQILGVPAWAGQSPGGGGEQGLALADGQHGHPPRDLSA